MLKNAGKILGMAAIVVVIGLIALYIAQYFQYRASPEYLVEKSMEELERRYFEDTYGGDTPEETLRLFIDALKKGDTDLAAKYFVLDKQKEWRNELLEIKERGLLGEMVKDIEGTKLTKKTEDEAFFTLVDDQNIGVAQIFIGKSQYNKKWKIYEL